VEQKSQLKRTLGLFEVTLSGIGIILGAGIYALIGEAAGLAGNAVWISFAISSLVALFTGLSYAELASMFPKASAEYEYTTQSFGKYWAFIIGWLIIFSGVIGSATVALGFAGYFTSLFGAPFVISALALIFILSLLVFIGIKQSVFVAVIFTAIEILGLVLIIIFGIPYLGSVNYLEMPFGLTGIFKASALIFFAFIGFQEIVKLSEETKDPEKNIPKGLILAIAASIIMYILVGLSAVSVLGWERLSQSSAPFADIAFAALGQQASFIVSIMALFATTNTVLLMLLASSRIVYGMSESGSLPGILSQIHPATRAPWTAIILVMVLAMAFVFLEDIAFVANINNFIVFITFIVINASLILLRYHKPEITRPFQVPLSIGRLPIMPALAIFFNAFMMLQLSVQVLAIGVGLTILGFLAAHISFRSANN